MVLLSALASRAQLLDDILVEYSDRFAPEKAWLHLDKSSYTPGETVWFKAYVLEDIFPAVKSKTIYIDWIGSEGTVLMHTVSPVVDGNTNGQFEIPETYKGDFIHVRAYTKWMLNFDTAFLYNRNIRVLQNKPVAASKKTAPAVSLQLFPEGGDLVAGVINRIAFKAQDQWGVPVAIRGKLQSDKESFIDSLRVAHDGMGSFFLNPAPGGNYFVKWKDEKGVERTTKLPVAKLSGITMQVSISGTRRIVTLNSSQQLPEPLKKLHLVGTLNGKKAFETTIDMKEGGSVQRLIPTEALPSGILTFTLFDAAWNAVAERISFVNNQEYTFKPDMEVLHWGMGRRKRNEISITVPDSLKGAHLSISITDLAIEKDSSENIVSHFLLSSELKGKVYNPAYYFREKTDASAQHLDFVMLTHGWRRFKWEDLTNGLPPRIQYPRDSTYLSLSGQLFGVAKSSLTGGETLALFIKEKDSAAKMAFMQVDKQGRFGDPSLVFFDTVRVYYGLKSKVFSQAEARFMPDRLPTPNYAAFSKGFTPATPFWDTTGAAYHAFLEAERLRLLQVEKGKVMETVIIKAKTKTPIELLDERYATGLFRTGDGYQFDLVNDQLASSYMNIFTFLQGRVAGLQVSIGGTPTLTWRGGTPQIFVDEFQTEPEMVSNIPVNDIAYVKVMRPPFFGGFGGGASGAIAIYTKKGQDASSSSSKGLTSNTVYGYTPIREFYSPNYERFDKRHEEKDLRTTLYWNPNVVIPAGSKSIKLNFHNNDVTKAFRIVIEGVSSDGLLTHYETVME